jgi:hypothetical protein
MMALATYILLLPFRLLGQLAGSSIAKFPEYEPGISEEEANRRWGERQW